MSRHVVSVEPFYDNIVRLHKAASLEKVQKKITLFANALSDKKNQLKRLAQSEFNIGGQSLLPYKDEEVKEWEEDGKDGKYLVKTTTLDDLVDFLPAEMTASGRREKAIMKIDIEDFEPYALQKASRMFEVLDICVVFMEWGNKAVNFASAPGLVHDMVEFLSSKGLKPYEEARALEVKMWRNWTWDIVWKKDGY
jgi:FkbM family methyltransferase